MILSLSSYVIYPWKVKTNLIVFSAPCRNVNFLWSAVAQVSPGSNPPLLPFQRLGPTRLSCINEYLAIDSG